MVSANKRKAVFLVLDNLSWNVFRQTGNVETYLMMKEFESQDQQQSQEPFASSPDPLTTNDQNS
ncbi:MULTISPECIES: YqzL family protein [Halobacillus]|uniref:YqzL family protein n=1 Tax=Halobacillus TaxID=45667 RepID=UPI001926FE02|nr:MULTISPECIES: YqzL family protein [Halobacillus]